MNYADARRQFSHRSSRVKPDDFYGFGGGLNLVDPPLKIPGGYALGAVNYEPYQEGGYRRVDGYEIFDGQLSPETYAYWRMPYVSEVGNTPVAGDVVTGVLSGATAVVLSRVPTNADTSVNLCTWSEDSRGSTYTHTNLTSVAESTPNPWGRKSIRLNATGAGDHKWVKSVLTAEKDIGVILWLKAGTSQRATLRISDGTAQTDFAIDLSALTITPSGGLTVVSTDLQVQDSGSGWYKVIIRCSTVLTITQWNISLFVANNSGVTNYTASGETAYFGGLVLNKQLASTSYLETNHDKVGAGYGTLYLATIKGTFLPGEPLNAPAGLWAYMGSTFAKDARTSAVAVAYGADRRYPVGGEVIVGALSGASAEVITNTPTTPLSYNQVIHSDELDNGWTLTNLNVSDVTQAIDPAFTQWQRLAATGTNGEHSISRSLATTAAGAFAAFIAVKKNVAGHVMLRIGTSGNTVDVYFDPNSARAYHSAVAGTATLKSIAVTEESADTLVLAIQGTLPAGARTIELKLTQTDSTTVSYAGASESIDCCGIWEVDGGSNTAPYFRTTTAPAGDGYGVITVINQQGEFLYGEKLQIGGVDYADCFDETQNANGGDFPTNRDELIAAAREYRRDVIAKPPGIGPARAVMVYNDHVYSVRDQADGTAKLYRGTSLGWSEIELGWQLAVEAVSSATLAEGVTVTGLTSSATGVVYRYVDLGGTVAGGTGKATLILFDVVGAFVDGESIQVSAVTVAKAKGDSFAQQLAGSGTYEYRVHNFYGAEDRRSLYFVNGVNNAVEYNDTTGVTVFIKTGMPDDKPTHLFVHNMHLFLSFRGGSLQNSGTGEPLNWSPIFGASELGVGEDVVGALEEYGTQEGDSTLVFCRNSTHVLYGKVREDFGIRRLGRDTGALRGTIQRIGPGIFLDDRGFKLSSTTDKYGNFKDDSISTKIEPLVKQLRQKAQCSVISNELSLYRIFFSDGSGLACGFSGNKPTGWMPIRYKQKVFAATVGEINGASHFYWCDFDGNVYRGDFGTSFNGESIGHYCRMSYYNCRSPSHEKRFREAKFEIEPSGQMTLKVFVDYDYAAPGSSFQAAEIMDSTGGGGIYGSAVWGEFVFGAGLIPDTAMPLEASGTNVSFLFSGDSFGEKSHILHGVSLQYSVRKVNRNRKSG